MDVKMVTPFMESFMSVIPQLGFAEAKKGKLSAKPQHLVESGVLVIVGVVGDIKGNVVYSMKMDNAKKIASKMMMGMPVDTLEGMAESALSELTNMLTANAATIFSGQGVFVDISTPTLLHGDSITAKMSSKQVLCIEMLADEIPIDISIAFEE